MRFEDLTPEQQEKAAACESGEELLALAREEGIELSDEELEKVAGGSDAYRRTPPYTCPYCNANGTVTMSVYKAYDWYCKSCRKQWSD